MVGFPGAFPYSAAADQILRVDPPATIAVVAVAYCVLIFILPLALIGLIRVVPGARGERLVQRIHETLAAVGPKVLAVLLTLLGMVLVADAVAYFLGEPLVPIGFP